MVRVYTIITVDIIYCVYNILFNVVILYRVHSIRKKIRITLSISLFLEIVIVIRNRNINDHY